jgi:hypothetical protein
LKKYSSSFLPLKPEVWLFVYVQLQTMMKPIQSKMDLISGIGIGLISDPIPIYWTTEIG